MNFWSIKNEVFMLPTPSGITYNWNFGSLLGACLFSQLISGLFLAMQFSASSEISFESVLQIMTEVNSGWAIRMTHANGASFFFILLYLHVGRGLYYGSYRFFAVWGVGVVIIFLSMGTAFLGYVLPWGQMSFWGATVITNLVTALPYWGEALVSWIWGGFCVSSPTLTRMFSIHFILPFMILFLVLSHLFFLHEKGSSNPLGVSGDTDKICFHPYFFVKDLVGLALAITLSCSLILISPDIFMDPDNFQPANQLVTPAHIKPEWYFLFAYSILRAVPSKLGGVIALVSSIAILALLPFTPDSSARFSFVHSVVFWTQTNNFLLLTWLGQSEVDYPFTEVSKGVGVMYFMIFLLWGQWKMKPFSSQ